MGKTGRGIPPILNRVKVKQAQESRVKQFHIQNIQNNENFRSPKCSKTIVELTFPTQKANACSLLDWLFCSVVLFLGKFGPKTQNCQFQLKFGT